MGERYEVRGKLGRGGMSTVYRAYDTVMGREVALKRLLDLEDTNLNEDSRGALEREAAALARFQHPNVVTIFALEEDVDGPFVAMELIEGEDLNEVVKDAALSVEDFLDVAEQCLDALASAAEINLLHRDIKPANIMLTMTPSDRFLVKILDFGLAKFSQQPSTQTLDHQGSFLGSIDYIAPEQLELKPLDQRTDLYSLGCVFYCGLTQESAFQGGSPAETSMNHINHRCTPIHEIRPDLPEHVSAWIMRLISRYPEGRPDNAKVAMKQFQDAVKGIPYQGDAGSEAAVATESAAHAVFAPPEQNPAPQTGPTRTIQTGPTRTIQTGPTRTIKTGSIREGESSATGTRRPVSRSTKSVTPSSGNGNPAKWVAIGVGALVIIIGAVMLFRGDDETSEEVVSEPEVIEEAVTEVEVEEEVSFFPEPSMTELHYTNELAPNEGDSVPPDLPVMDGLVGRFVSNVGTFGRDYKSKASNGTRIAAWYNLAKPEPLSSLFRNWADEKGNYLPLAMHYTPETLPGIDRPRHGVLFTNASSLGTRSRDFDFSKGFSFVAAMSMELGEDRFIRFLQDPWDVRAISVGTTHDGRVFASVSMDSGDPSQKIGVEWWDREPGVIGYTCNVEEGHHQIFTIDQRGNEEASEQGKAEGNFEGLNRFILGRSQFDTGFENPNGHVIFDFAIYDRALTEEELREVQRYLYRRYLNSAAQ